MRETIMNILWAVVGPIVSGFNAVVAFLTPALQAFFAPVNTALATIGPFWWKTAAAGLFLCAILWVFSLRKEYVNIDAPKKGLLYDLRLWTVVSMAPHIIIYLWFNR